MSNLDILLDEMRNHIERGDYANANSVYSEFNQQFGDHPVDERSFQFQLLNAASKHHEGKFKDSLYEFERISTEVKDLKDAKFATLAIFYNADVQRAMLLERLGRRDDAMKLINELYKLHPPENVPDIGICRSSLQSWMDTTVMKCALANKNANLVTETAKKGKDSQDWNQKLWSEMFLTGLNIAYGKSTLQKSLASIHNILEGIAEKDFPGKPWFALLAAQFLSGHPDHAIRILEEARADSIRLRKNFPTAIATIELIKHFQKSGVAQTISYEQISDAAASLYRCNLLTDRLFYRPLYLIAVQHLGEESARRLLNAHTELPDPANLKFSEMCKRIGKRDGKDPFTVFEDFVCAWAKFKYQGEPEKCHSGEALTDIIVNNNGSGILLQAKHGEPDYLKAKKNLPNLEYVADLLKRYRLKNIEEYVYVISTTESEGWKEEYWHIQYTMRIERICKTLNIKARVVTESALQNDCLKYRSLLANYFSLG